MTLIDWITRLPSFHEKEHSCLQVIQPFARFTATPECLLKLFYVFEKNMFQVGQVLRYLKRQMVLHWLGVICGRVEIPRSSGMCSLWKEK